MLLRQLFDIEARLAEVGPEGINCASDARRGYSLSEKGHLSYFNVETGEVTKTS